MMNQKTCQTKLELPNRMKVSGFEFVPLVTSLKWPVMSAMAGCIDCVEVVVAPPEEE